MEKLFWPQDRHVLDSIQPTTGYFLAAVVATATGAADCIQLESTARKQTINKFASFWRDSAAVDDENLSSLQRKKQRGRKKERTQTKIENDFFFL